MLVRFRIRGNLRFISHSETIKVFQRACVRAGIKAVYSRGFNPRPKLSLPLPRSVGVESDDDLLCLWVQSRSGDDSRFSFFDFDAEEFKTRLSAQLPEGCQLLSVSVSAAKTSFQADSAEYVFPVQREYLDEQLMAGIKRLLASESLDIQRRTDGKGNIRDLDVRGFLKSIEMDENGVTVECKISSAGSIRVEEILGLLELDIDKLSAPIRRTAVQWKEA